MCQAHHQVCPGMHSHLRACFSFCNDHIWLLNAFKMVLMFQEVGLCAGSDAAYRASELYPRNLLTSCASAMKLGAYRKQIAQGVLFAESGTHECQSAIALPTQLSQTALILVSLKSQHFTFFTCYPIPFWAKLFVRRFGRCSQVKYAPK